MSLPEYSQRHISELTLDNSIEAADYLPWEDETTSETKKLQFGGLVTLLRNAYFAAKNLSNISAADAKTFATLLANPDGIADVGAGLLLRTHANNTQEGLATLSNQLILATAHVIADKYFENLTTEEFQHLCDLLSGAIARESSETVDGTLLNQNVTSLTDTGYNNIKNVRYVTIAEASGVLSIPASAMNKIVRVNLTGNITNITFPTPTGDFGQVILLIKRNGFSIASTALSVNNYVARNNPAGTLLLGTSTIDSAVEIYAEYDNWTNESNPTWMWGMSKIGH